MNIFVLLNILIFFFAKIGLNFKAKFFTFTPILLSILASFLHIYPFERRLILYLLPLYIILYSQFIFFIKPNKLFKTLAMVILVILSFLKLNVPINSIYYAYFKQPVRNAAEFIIQNKIPANKIIFASNKLPYYLHDYLQNESILLFDDFWFGFNKSRIPKGLKKIPQSDYYIFIPMCCVMPDYYSDLIHFLNNDKHIKILNTYTKDGYIYIIHFEKILDYK